jgi:uncharacterized protein with NRDE domain
MCTIVARVPSSPDEPLVVAANRDELLARPARPPFVWPGEPRFVAPRDEEAGGTWLGVTARGMFVGVTNRAADPRDPTRRSRGEIVARALAAPSARALHGELASLDAGLYNGFHLIYVDRTGAFLTWSEAGARRQRELGPGLVVVSERSPFALERGAPDAGVDTPRAALVRDRFAELAEPHLRAGDDDALLAGLGALLAIHGDEPFHGTCVHLDDFAYGTRSSMGLLLGAGRAKLRWLEGKPCRAAWEDRSELLRGLGL